MKCKKIISSGKTIQKLVYTCNVYVYTCNVYFENRKKIGYTRGKIQSIEKSIVHCSVLTERVYFIQKLDEFEGKLKVLLHHAKKM